MSVTVADLRVRFSADTRDAERGISNLDNRIRGLRGTGNALGGMDLGRVFEFATGSLIADGIRSIGSALVDVGGQALDSYASFERLTMSLETFAAKELMNAGVTDNMRDALSMSGERAQELLGWIEKLAVESPFKSSDIASAFRLSQAYGFTSDQAMRLTQATVDFAAGAGISGAMMDRISLALGQIQARGKVSAQELNQLSEAGINARQILANAFGVSTAAIGEMIEKGLVPADLAIEAITQSLEKDFGGAAKRQANTFSGLISSLGDLKEIGLREFFAGTFQAVQPSLVRIVGLLTDPAVKESLRSWGDTLGAYIGGALATVETRLDRAIATFNLLSTQGDPTGGMLAALGQMTGATVTIDTKAQVTSVDWGTWNWAYDAKAQILSVDWVNSLLAGTGGFTYDTAAQVLTVDYTSAVDNGGYKFVYDAEAGITYVDWNGGDGGFQYTYDATAGIVEVDWGIGTYQYSATAGITNVQWFDGLYYGHYEATAGVTDVSWGVYTHTYQPDAEVTSVLWGTYTHSYKTATEVVSVLWGAWNHSYAANSEIFSVLWGAFAHTYDGDVGINSVLWGVYTNTYDASANVAESNVLWGAYSHQYDATVKIGESSILWGAYAHTYDAQAQVGEKSILWGLWTWTYDAQANVTSIQGTDTADFIVDVSANIKSWTGIDLLDLTLAAPTWLSRLTVASPTWLPLLTIPAPVFNFTWPALPDWTWPAYTDWAWPDLPGFTWPDYNIFAWPGFPTFDWPEIPMPGWVNQLVALLGGGASASRQSAVPAQSSGGWWDWLPGNAAGTDFWGGGWTWVGEQGPELLNLPRGSQILSNAESMKMVGDIGQLAEGTTTAPSAWPVSGAQFADITRAHQLGAKYIGQAGDATAKKISAAMKKAADDLKNALSKVPGLFGTSPVTQQQMDLAALGVPQNFADDWIRRLTDEVVNGVDWADTDIQDAAIRAGIDPSLPAKAILELVKQQWNDSSFFAGGKNTELINQDAVREALQRQADAKSGQQAIYALFGITPEQAQGQAVALGGTLRSGISQGLTATGGEGAAPGLLAGFTDIPPEQFAPVGVAITDGLALEVGKPEYADKIGEAISKMFTGFLENKDALTDVSAALMGRITEGLGAVQGLDMVGRFAAAYRGELALPESIKTLQDIGARILDYVFQGYTDAAKERNWPAATVSLPSNTTAATAEKPRSVALPAGARAALGTPVLAGVGAGEAVTVNVYANVANAIDVNAMAYQISEILQRRRR